MWVAASASAMPRPRLPMMTASSTSQSTASVTVGNSMSSLAPVRVERYLAKSVG